MPATTTCFRSSRSGETSKSHNQRNLEEAVYLSEWYGHILTSWCSVGRYQAYFRKRGCIAPQQLKGRFQGEFRAYGNGHGIGEVEPDIIRIVEVHVIDQDTGELG